MRIIQDDSIPTPKGHYSPIVEHAGTLYVSGQLPVDPASGEVPLGLEAQAKLALENVERLLIAAGSDRSKLVQVRIYVVDVALWSEFNRIYAEFMGDHRPARIVVPSGPLHYGCLLEIEAIAAT